LIYRLGEEPKSRRIASAIIRARPIETTTRLAEVVARATGGKRGRIHPATRTFQAIRMAVNEELENVEAGLMGAVDTLRPGGRLAVISYHSLEDRVVKGFIGRESRDCICQPEVLRCECGHEASLRRVNKKVIKPTRQEIEANPRARSARLRVAERIGTLAGTLRK
jgi:16S rRNA (cytosine1402-N4)-methyltransferase